MDPEIRRLTSRLEASYAELIATWLDDHARPEIERAVGIGYDAGELVDALVAALHGTIDSFGEGARAKLALPAAVATTRPRSPSPGGNRRQRRARQR